ncbi:MAG: 1-deoxy-D-xylulose-5-phosphate reductoisomerase [Phycisphaerales bacterium]
MSKHTDNTPANPSPCRVLLLGSTGSIGCQSLEVIAHLNSIADGRCFEVVGLAAGSDAPALFAQAKAWGVEHLALCCDDGSLVDHEGIELRVGTDAACRLVEEVECDLVIGAIVGIAGLESVYRAVELGIDVALANKETLVAAGELVIRSARASGARLLPIDSEHAGVWQCLGSLGSNAYCPPMPKPDGVRKVVLTASGGPFRGQSRDAIEQATLDQALNHPNWSMGAKVTIDSATLMNKALELIEAHWLFDLGDDDLNATIHPQSVVHAMIECSDGSVIAQMGATDMKAPIQYALCFPDRLDGCSRRLDITGLGDISFEKIDHQRFPAIELALDAIRAGGDAGAWLNAANERAVEAYMNHQIPFGMIDQIVAEVMHQHSAKPIASLEDVYEADRCARACAQAIIVEQAGRVGGVHE